MTKDATKPTPDAGTALHTVPVSPAGAATSRTMGNLWCPYRQAMLLQQAVTSNKTKVAFLLGAGCGVSIRGTDNAPLIPDIAGLTRQISEKFQTLPRYKSTFNGIIDHLKETKPENQTIEDVLTYIRSLAEVIGHAKWNGLDKIAIANLDTLICREIYGAVNVELPNDMNPYYQLASWIGGIQRVHPVEIFTTNYDLLTEQALVSRRVPYFDGFVGSHRTFFDLSAIELDELPRRWARLWKIHGSINWYQDGDNVTRGTSRPEQDRLLIYPSHLKYAQSRRMPYLAMLDRLRAFLNCPQAVLITCGYSFEDMHINEVLLQGLNSNATAQCFGLIFDKRARPAAKVQAHKCANLSLLAADGAVIGTITRDWSDEEKSVHPMHGVAVRIVTAAPAEPPKSKFLLGDFKAFGEFLARQLANRRDDEGAINVP